MFRNLLRGRDVQELKELQRQGMSIQAISELTGWDRKTIRKYMQAAGVAPEYGPRSAPPSKLDAFKPYLEGRLSDGGGNARGCVRRRDERREIVWHPVFLDFARYWGFTPRLCRPYRAQTKGKVEAGVKYVRRNFLCGLQGREPGSLSDLNAQLREWIWGVANQRVHGTTHEQVMVRWDVEQLSLQSLPGHPPHPDLIADLPNVPRHPH